MKSFFTDKSKTRNNIILNENEKTKDGKEIAYKFNKYFANIKKLHLKKDTGTSFEFQESCRMIKKKFGKENSLFEVFTKDAVANAIENLRQGKCFK